MKSGFIAIIGRPSSGKSTLLNTICGYKISITASSPQTTRNKIRGIYTDKEKGQLVFLDTPGYHISDKKFNTYMMNAVHSSISEADVVMYVVDSTRPLGKEEQEIIELVNNSGKPLVLVLNKNDLNSKFVTEMRGFLLANIKPKAVLEVSALKEDGINGLKDSLIEECPEGPFMYPPDYYTDQEPEFRMAEIIREKAIRRVKDEVPHAIYVEMADTEYNAEENTMWVRAFITVEQESQKGFVIGHKGETIKKIRMGAQRELNKIFSYKIKLDLRVKVNKKWRRKDYLLKGLLK
ncbi:MAG: GTPase Era [Spirochaetaceae bacterium 4572_7]|nr:MAG: GTPase Era [Spirochaetaceae bacterium 4572_7]